MTDLKPCPFCGEENPAIMYFDFEGRPISWLQDKLPESITEGRDEIECCRILCLGRWCGCRILSYYPDTIVESWNRRVKE